MKKRGIDLRIGRLVVRGLGPVGEGRLRDAVERELGRRLAAETRSGDLDQRGSEAQVRVKTDALAPGADGERVASTLADTVVGTLRGGKA
jgi:hypothetical protein